MKFQVKIIRLVWPVGVDLNGTLYLKKLFNSFEEALPFKTAWLDHENPNLHKNAL